MQADPIFRERLEVLFEESSALANRLKKNARNLHRTDNLSASGRILLQTLHLHGPQTVPQLAALRSTSRQNIQVLVDRLNAAGFIAFESNPRHRRSVLVALTDAGRALLSSANEREAELLASLLPHASQADVMAAAELLHKLRLLLGGEPRRRRAAGRSDPEPTPPAAADYAETELPVSLL